MKNKLLPTLVLLAAPVLAHAQVQLVAGWDFAQFTFEGFAFTRNDDSFVNATSIPANYSSVGAFNPVSTHYGDNSPISAGTGSIGWALADADANLVYAISNLRDSTQNRGMADFPGTLMSNSFADPASLALGFAGMSGKSFTVTTNLAGFADFDPALNGNVANFSFSAAADSAVSIEWFYNSASIGMTTIAGGNTHTAYTLDLPSTFYGQESTLVGVISSDVVFMLDNVQVNGVSAIPEPSTYALLAGAAALALAAYRRRQARA